MKKDEFYKRVKDYEISHSGMPKNPRKDHKYLYIDKNGRYVYEEPNPRRAYLDRHADDLEKRTQAGLDYLLEQERKDKENHELAKSVVDSYARSQENTKNRQAADDARNAYAKSQEKTNSSTGSRPYSSPNDIKVVSGSDKEKFASSVKANDRIRKNQEIWAEFEKNQKEKAESKAKANEEWKQKWNEKYNDEKDDLEFLDRLSGYVKDNIRSRPYSNPNTSTDYEGKVGADISGTTNEGRTREVMLRYSENAKKDANNELTVIAAKDLAKRFLKDATGDTPSKNARDNAKIAYDRAIEDIRNAYNSIENPEKKKEFEKVADEAIKELDKAVNEWLATGKSKTVNTTGESLSSKYNKKR